MLPKRRHQQRARPGEPRHHGADRDARRIARSRDSDRSLNSRITSASRKGSGSAAIARAELRRSRPCDQAFPRARDWVGAGGVFEVADAHDSFSPSARQPRQGRVAHDGEKPRARRCGLPRLQRGQSPHAGVLHDIFRIARVAGQPARKTIGIVEMRQDSLREETADEVARSCRRPHALFASSESTLAPPDRSGRHDDLACHMRMKAAERRRIRPPS